MVPRQNQALAGHRQWVLTALEQNEGGLVRYCARMLHGDYEAARDVVQHVGHTEGEALELAVAVFLSESFPHLYVVPGNEILRRARILY